MNIGIPTLGSVSLYFLVGYLSSLCAVMLSVGIRTPFSSRVFDAVQKSPVTSLLIAAPFVLLLGVFVNMFRAAIVRLLIKRQSYDFTTLPEILMEALKQAIAMQLSIDEDEVNLHNDRHFETTKQLLLPEMDEYIIRARWLHDFFENTVLVASFCLIVLAFRATVFGLKEVDWVLLLGSGFAGFFAIVFIPYLRKAYTISEVSLVVRNHRSGQAK